MTNRLPYYKQDGNEIDNGNESKCKRMSARCIKLLFGLVIIATTGIIGFTFMMSSSINIQAQADRKLHSWARIPHAEFISALEMEMFTPNCEPDEDEDKARKCCNGHITQIQKWWFDCCSPIEWICDSTTYEFTDVEYVARGQHSSVYKARNRHTGQVYAIKVSKDPFDHMHKEFEIHKRIHAESSENSGDAYFRFKVLYYDAIAMEWLEGQTLNKLLRANTFNAEDASKISKQIIKSGVKFCAALAKQKIIVQEFGFNNMLNNSENSSKNILELKHIDFDSATDLDKTEYQQFQPHGSPTNITSFQWWLMKLGDVDKALEKAIQSRADIVHDVSTELFKKWTDVDRHELQQMQTAFESMRKSLYEHIKENPIHTVSTVITSAVDSFFRLKREPFLSERFTNETGTGEEQWNKRKEGLIRSIKEHDKILGQYVEDFSPVFQKFPEKLLDLEKRIDEILDGSVLLELFREMRKQIAPMTAQIEEMTTDYQKKYGNGAGFIKRASEL